MVKKSFKHGGARPNAGRITGKKIITDKALESKSRGVSLDDVEYNTFKVLGGSKWLQSALELIYLKHSDKYFKIPACKYNLTLQLDGVFEVINKSQYDENPKENNYDLTTLISIHNGNGSSKIILETKDAEITL